MLASHKTGTGASTVVFYALFTFAAIGFAGTYSGGSGTVADPYQIDSAEDLIALGQTPEDYGQHFILTSDIDLIGNNFDSAVIAPDPSPDYDFQGIPFTGSLDGNRHIISNLHISGNDKEYIGLFGCITNGYIKNIGMLGTEIQGHNKVGGLVGFTFSGIIENCFISGTVSGNGQVGGILGWGSSYPLISQSYASGQVSGTISVGGIAGKYSLGYSGIYHSSGIHNCYTNNTVVGEERIGGILGDAGGYSIGEIKNCYVVGSVSGNPKGPIYGYRDQYGSGIQILDCFWDKDTTGLATGEGFGLSTEKMKLKSTFMIWSCEGVWTIDDGYDYPRLIWENTIGEPIPQPVYGGGSGTSEDPFLIYTPEQFIAIGYARCHLNQNFRLMNDIDLLDYKGQYRPIGDSAWGRSFTGDFDGNGHSIKNYEITSTTYAMPVGIFGQVGGSSIHDINVINPRINIPVAEVGALVGILQSGQVYNCIILDGSIQGIDSVGGLIGIASQGDIYNCSVRNIKVSGNINVGGIIEYSKGTDSYLGGFDIWDCIVSGNVSGTDCVGGVIGYCTDHSTIKNCITEGTIFGRDYIGGIIGLNMYYKDIIGGATSSCQSSCKVIGNNYVGGLTGKGTVSESSSSGAVSGNNYVGGLTGYGGCLKSWATGDVTGKNYIGGLSGHAGSSYEAPIKESYYIGTVKGVENVGGLAGYNVKYNYVNDYAKIERSFSAGKVNGQRNVGGLIGFSNGLDITDCYSSCVVVGGSITGGLIGDAASNSIVNCYSVGYVSGFSDVGGLVGKGGYCLYSYWDIETSGQTKSSVGQGYSTQIMKQPSLYIPWSCSSAWTHDAGNDYPHLVYENQPGEHLSPPTYHGGSGTENDPYCISTPLDLYRLMKTRCHWSKKYFVLLHDLDLNQLPGEIDGPIELEPIGLYRIQFKGVFDGNNHVISNFHITTDSDGGLFGCTGDYSQIKNLGVERFTINGRASLGGLAGSCYGSIINCYTNGTINCASNSADVGGLVGYAYTWTGTIDNCFSLGNINSLADSENIGGLVGYSASSTIRNCNSSISVNGNQYIGGLVGKNYRGRISSCFSDGVINGSRAGGLVGYNEEGTIELCYAMGYVTGTGNVGGLLGENDAGTISNCYAMNSVQGKNGVGGLVGYNVSGTINKCFSCGKVTKLPGSSSTIGGLCGWQYDSTTTSSYWDIRTSGWTSSAGGFGRTTAEMKKMAFFSNAGWDFVGDAANKKADYWRMCVDGVDYPRLSWEFSRGGDLNCPNGVGIEDLAYLAGRWMAGTPAAIGAADIDGDGKVDLGDFEVLASNWMRE